MGDKLSGQSTKWFHGYPIPDWLSVFGLILFLIWIAYVIYISNINAPIEKRAQLELEREFNEIAPIADSELVEQYSSDKSGLQSVTSSYKAPYNFEDIFAWYEGELNKYGWIFYGTSPIAQGGRRVAYFCKGEYEAYIVYAGNAGGGNWTYSFGLNYIPGGCQDRLDTGWVKQTLSKSLFFIAVGVFLLFSGWYFAKESWSRDTENYLRLRYSRTVSTRLGRWISGMQKPSVWTDRIGSIFMLIAGTGVFLFGIYSLWRNIFMS